MDAASHHIGYLLKRAQHGLRLRMDEALRGVGLTTPQYAALSELAEQPGLSGAALARACFVTPQTMNEILVALARADLVTRLPHPEHGRIMQAQLTEQGMAALAAAHDLVFAIEDHMVSPLAEDARRQMADMLRQCAVALENGGG